MKKSLTKLIVSCAAVAAVTAAMAVSVSAADATYSDGVLTPGIKSKAATGSQATVLVYQATTAEDEATADNIVYIDQQPMADTLWNTIPVTLDETKSYVIKMGGEGVGVESTVYGKAASTGLKGDVTDDEMVDYEDALAILNAEAGNITLTPEQEAVADVTGDDMIDYEDALDILNYEAGNPSYTGGTKN